MLKSRFIDFLRDEEGASAVEYALMASMVAAALVTLVPGIRTAVVNIFKDVCTAVGGTSCT